MKPHRKHAATGYRAAKSTGLDSDQRKRLQVDLANILRTANAERANATKFRRVDNDEDSAIAAEARADDADQEAAAIRVVLARFPATNRTTSRSYRR